MQFLSMYLRQWVHERRLTSSSLAEATGCDVATIQAWLDGLSTPDRSIRIRLAPVVRKSPLLLERLACGWTQRMAAEQLGLSQPTLRTLEAGYQSGILELWLLAAEVYAIADEDLVAMMRVQVRLGRPQR